MVVRRKRELGASIADLDQKFSALKKTGKITAVDLANLSKASYAVIDRIEDIFAYSDPNLIHLEKFIEQMLAIISELHHVAVKKNSDPPPTILKHVTTAFEEYINLIISKEQRSKLRKAVAAIPIIENVVYCCETLPSLWHEANRNEKIMLVLGATLVITALAFTIASFIVPNPIPVLMAPVGIMLLGSIGTALYRYVVESPKQKAIERTQIKEVLNELDSQMADLNSLLKDNFKANLTRKEYLGYSKPKNQAERKLAKAIIDKPASKRIDFDSEIPKRDRSKGLLRPRQNKRGLESDDPIRSH